MSTKGAGVVVADDSTYKLVEATRHIVAGTRTTSFKRPQEESGPHEGAAGAILPSTRGLQRST